MRKLLVDRHQVRTRVNPIHCTRSIYTYTYCMCCYQALAAIIIKRMSFAPMNTARAITATFGDVLRVNLIYIFVCIYIETDFN